MHASSGNRWDPCGIITVMMGPVTRDRIMRLVPRVVGRWRMQIVCTAVCWSSCASWMPCASKCLLLSVCLQAFLLVLLCILSHLIIHVRSGARLCPLFDAVLQVRFACRKGQRYRGAHCNRISLIIFPSP